ncbi:uncharacterized protein C8A04DRAFT_27446 [Dichotomopilus funicola]|uniref:Protein kinase domain-containing protein n=1 Tax=Dichotomopilus funicola TaxID=1934379 RepID=A0AAN6V5A0_9PEZI|nr:hypothetical protein C8A04DRAFT_27446 [Dichotomopilus funicola]
MDLTSAAIHDVIHPTAAFNQNRTPHQPRSPLEAPSWNGSQLNPKNRLDSLELPQRALFRIDGCTGLGTQFHAVPLFLPDLPPMWFDVFLPKQAVATPELYDLLDMHMAFHTRDALRVRRLGISIYVVRALHYWISDRGYETYSALFEALPFGSRIIFDVLHLDVRRTKISVVPTYYVERQLLGLSRLDRDLDIAPELLPEAVDISRLSFVQRLQDSVCLVRMREAGHGGTPGNLWVFKALTSSTKYLFLELRNLLRMKPHPNVISRPGYLITKRCLFGGKTAVIGFLLPFHEHGSVRDLLPLMRIHGQLKQEQQLRWARQLTSAVLHVHTHGKMFYPDLRLDNILFSASQSIIMVDFEQRGVWCEFASPEVNAIEYMRILASDPADETAGAIPENVRGHFAAIVNRLLPDWGTLQSREDYATPRPNGYSNYNIPWLALDATEQEASMVYMLGRVLWCIFEGQSAPENATVWQSYRYEPDVEFPTFHSTPPELRSLIDQCTRGRRVALSSLIIREGSRLVLRDKKGGSAAEVTDTARAWWQAEVKAAEDFIKLREESKKDGSWDSNYFGRPRLADVLNELERLSKS